MISTLALDLDGTLLDPEGNVSHVNRYALERAADRGIRILLCSGRHHFDVTWIAGSLGTVSCLASSNGAFLTTKEGDLIHSSPMTDVEVVNVAGAIAAAGLSGIWYGEKRIILEPQCPVLPWYRRRDETIGGALRLSVVDDALSAMRDGDDRIYKVAVSGYSGDRFATFEQLLESDGIRWTSSASHNREIMACGVSKATAVEKALEYLGRERDELVAIGDGLNDIELLRAAGLGIAMGNACEELKDVACGICPSNRDDGVAAVVDMMLDGTIEDLRVGAVGR